MSLMISSKCHVQDHRKDNTMIIKFNAAIARFLVVLVASAVCIAGCGPPQATPQNQQLISSLRTALSAQNPEWLDQNVKLLEERRTAGQVSDGELEAFQAIIEQARAGQWKEAEEDAIAFQKAQRPTREQIERATKHAP
jgi:hypothetical protein